MTTNFFQTLAGLQINGGWRLNILPTKEGKMVVSVLLFDGQTDDTAAKLIQPLILEGTPLELDNGFFQGITEPMKKTSQLFSNMGQYMKGLEEAKKNSKMEQDKKGKEKKTEGTKETSKEATFETEMEKVDDLMAQGKFSDALLKLPSKEKYPDHADEIEEKRDELWEQQDRKDNNLFNH